MTVVSTFDPDNLIVENGLRSVGANVSRAAAAVREFLGSPKRWRAASADARRRYLENHMVDRVMTGFESLFLGVACVGGFRQPPEDLAIKEGKG